MPLNILIPFQSIHGNSNKKSSSYNSYSHHGYHQNHGPEMASIQILHHKVAQNTITEFKLGFEEGEFRSQRDVDALLKLIEGKFSQLLFLDKFSCLDTIRIGWKLPRFARGPILQQAIPSLLRSPAKVSHLQLCLDAWVPLATLQRMISWHTLQTLELSMVRVRIRAMSDPTPTAVSSSSTGFSSSRGGGSGARHHHHHNAISASCRDNHSIHSDDLAIMDDCVVVILPFVSESVTTLKLVNCDLRGYHIPEIVEWVQKQKKLRTLSLRHNRDLDGSSLRSLVKNSPHVRNLDLSICELDPSDGFALADAISQRTVPLQRLRVAGNYRISLSIPKLLQVTCTRLVELDVSFCDVQSSKLQVQIFDILANEKNCTLRTLVMHGTRLNEVDPLVNCLKHNQSLRRLILNNPKDPYQVGPQGLRKIVEVVPNNYYIYDLRLDYYSENQHIVDQMKFWLQLNECGRSILLENNANNTTTTDNNVGSNSDWGHVLARAAAMNDLNILHWLVHHGAGQF